jgi:Dyp-type peroxidase family
MSSVETGAAPIEPSSIESARGDIQGNILRAYGFPYARYEILRIVDAAGARRLLRRVLERGLITTADTWDPASKPDATLNVFVSWPGLVALGIPQASLDSFPEEFRQGMPARASILGDTGANAPSTWEFGNDPDRTHVFFALYGRTAEARERLLASLRAELAQVGAAVEVTHQLDAQMLGNHREHFGFMDGIGQPAIEGSGNEEYPGDGTPLAVPGGAAGVGAPGGAPGGVPGGAAGVQGWAPLKAGEFVLGWPGETGFPPPAPQPDVLAKNGSFLVYRKLRQDVAAFRAFLRDESARLWGADAGALGVERLASKLVGRWRSGCPVMLAPLVDNPAMGTDWARNNDFRYAGDPRGEVCPFGSHIRRMNPRDGLADHGDTLVRTHRIVRRGLPYGSWLDDNATADDGQERGVAFMAINASIKYQFEFLQSQWLHNGEFAGLARGDVDPLAGEPRKDSRFRIPSANAAPRNLFDLPRFITLRGGGYFFIPSVTALHYIADPE